MATLLSPNPSPAVSSQGFRVASRLYVSPSQEILFAYRNSLGAYALRIGLHTVPAIILGIIVDKIVAKLQQLFNIPPIVAIIIQLLIVIYVLYLIEIYISKQYAFEWQNTTPGLFFSGFFFGTQFNLFTNISTLWKASNADKKE